MSADAKIKQLLDEVKEARNEAAHVRRAYLHERDRANRTNRALEVHDSQLAQQLAETAYRGPRESKPGEANYSASPEDCASCALRLDAPVPDWCNSPTHRIRSNPIVKKAIQENPAPESEFRKDSTVFCEHGKSQMCLCVSVKIHEDIRGVSPERREVMLAVSEWYASKDESLGWDRPRPDIANARLMRAYKKWFDMDPYAANPKDFSWIKVKSFVDDETKSWEERFSALKKHHEAETTFLIDEVEKLRTGPKS